MPDLCPIELLDVEQLTPRLSELRLRSAVLGRETKVRVLAPSAAMSPSAGGLPVLFLLHGGGSDSDHSNWTECGSAEALTEGLPLLVVMPDGGKGGWYSDWLRPDSAEGTQRWEQYHIRELLPFVVSHFGSRADRAGTAVVGLSMGGFGAVHYAARHPDLFGFTAAFSGAVDIRHPGIGRVVRVSPEIMGGRRGDIFGDHVADEVVWRAANPVDLAANLATVEVELRTGNGERGGLYGDGPDGDTQELGVGQATATCIAASTTSGSPTCTTTTDRAPTPGRIGTPRWPPRSSGSSASLASGGRCRRRWSTSPTNRASRCGGTTSRSTGRNWHRSS